MFHRARHHKGHVMIFPLRIECQLMQASLSLQPCQGHTASHDPALPSNHSAGYVHSERHVGHTHRPPPPPHTLSHPMELRCHIQHQGCAEVILQEVYLVQETVGMLPHRRGHSAVGS